MRLVRNDIKVETDAVVEKYEDRRKKEIEKIKIKYQIILDNYNI